MSFIQKIIVLIIAIFVTGCLIWSVYEVHMDACKTLTPGYFFGKIIDKGESIGKSSYRWVIADWETLDGKHLGISEINAQGLPINQLKVGDTIRTERTLFLYGFFWFKMGAGLAYTPHTLPPIMYVLALVAQCLMWVLVIWLALKSFFLLSPKGSINKKWMQTH